MNPENRQPNHLIHEKSPYLLQHAYNPVNWYPWNEEAFAKAKAEDKPIFLSIGYSTCHWCHVMERESFEDQEVADLLNENFIAIKVDKEERPDVDTIYMNVCQAINGHGGWPLTILMTPDQKPFYAGTYFPKHSNGQMPGIMELLSQVVKVWKEDKQNLVQSGNEIVRQLKQLHKLEKNRGSKPGKQLFGMAFATLSQQFDELYGGFGAEPKFPMPHQLMFLLRYAVKYQDTSALKMVENTLDAMYAGGIYDHIGGGFSRYSTDRMWLVPHFEKMLYDNALLVMLYTEAYQVMKKPLYETVVRETLQYVLEELTDENGGFYCAQDADCEGEEGKYYVLTQDEIFELLGPVDGEKFNEFYQITKEGNFEGANIPNRIGKPVSEYDHEMTKLRERIREYRKERYKLHTDDKILTSWNGLMITAFAKAYKVLNNVHYLDAARKCYAFLSEKLRSDQKRLYVRYRDGHQFGLGNLEDYAFVAMAEIAMYEATFEPSFLASAVQDAKEMIHLFSDEDEGGFYYYGSDADELILRPKEVYDGAIPSGNSVALFVLDKIQRMTRDEIFWDVTQMQSDFIEREIASYPAAYSFALCALMGRISDGREIVCVIKDGLQRQELHQLLSDYFLADASIIVIEEECVKELLQVIPYVLDYQWNGSECEIHICEHLGCLPALSGMEAFKQYLEQYRIEK